MKPIYFEAFLPYLMIKLNETQSMLPKFSPALRLALLYFIVGSLWILVSDEVVASMIGNDTQLLHKVQSVKGIGFVIFCSFLLFFVSRSSYRKISRSLQKSEEMLNRYKALGQATKEGIVDLDLVSDDAEINEQMQNFIDTKESKVENFSMIYRNRIHPDDLGRIAKNFEDTLNTNSNLWQVDYRYKMNGNKYHDMISRGYIIRDQDSKPFRIIAAVQDVTEVRNMRSALFQQELKHRQMLGQSIIKTQEEERNRWALELHDNVGQLLTVIKLYMEQMSIEPSKTSALLPKAQEMTEKVLNDIRQLSASMKPPEFSVTSLNEAIRQLVANIQRVKTFQFDLHLDSMCEKQLNDDHKLMIFRVVQEQLNNIIKYAQANHIAIHIETTAQKATIEIVDDGKGFDTSIIASGIGLRNIRSRLQVYAGQLEIDSSPGEGCKLIAEFGLV